MLNLSLIFGSSLIIGSGASSSPASMAACAASAESFSACFCSLDFLGLAPPRLLLVFAGSSAVGNVDMIPPTRFGSSGETALRSEALSPRSSIAFVCRAFFSARCASLMNFRRSCSSSAAWALAIAISFCSMFVATVFSRRRFRCISFFRSFSAWTSFSCTDVTAASRWMSLYRISP